MTIRAVCSLLLCVALAGCGGGSVEFHWVSDFRVFGGEPRITTSGTVELSGSAFLPSGATCTFIARPFAPAVCSCETGGQAIGHWVNTTTGAAGTMEVTVISSASCVAVGSLWRTPAISLAPGSNFISLSLSDAATHGGVTVTVVHN